MNTINDDMLRILEAIVAAWKAVPEDTLVPEEINVDELWAEADRVISEDRRAS